MGKILVSSCLIGKKCAYDGRSRTSDDVIKLSEQAGFIDVCPELLAGLGCPREKHEIAGGSGEDVLSGRAKVVSESGKDHTQSFINGAKDTLKIAFDHGINVAILKANSPSCGGKMIYSGDFDGVLHNGKGVTAQLLLNRGIKVFSEEDIHQALNEINENK